MSIHFCFKYKDIITYQNPNISNSFRELFKRIKPSRILEIGTGNGGVTLILRDLLDELNMNDCIIKTYDIVDHTTSILKEHKNIDLKIQNIFDNDYNKIIDSEVINFIKQDGVTVILCDGTNNKLEFKLLSQYIKINDIIMAHDYAKDNEYFLKYVFDKVWNFWEISEFDIKDSIEKYKLDDFMFEDFAKVAWCCKIRRKTLNDFTKSDIDIIEKNINNIFFYWDGRAPVNRMKILEDALYSTRIFNVDRPIYLISNTVDENMLDPDFDIKIIKWDYSFFEGTIPDDIIKKYMNVDHRTFSDFLRMVLLYKFGGSYIDTDDLCIRAISNVNNIICRSYDPHTCFYNHIKDDDCIDGKYREISGYEHIKIFPRNDCWHNFEPNHDFIKQLFLDDKFVKSEKALDISDNVSWQSLIFENIKKNINTINIDYRLGLTLLCLYEDFMSASSKYDNCQYGGELCDIYSTLPNIKDYPWGKYRCTKEVAVNFYNLILNKYPYVSHMWLHLKDMEKEWFIYELDDNAEYLLSTWIYSFVREKMKKYKLEKNKFSVIIPTLWKSNYIYKLLDDLNNSEYVGEIILIDNSNEYNKFIKKEYDKVKLITPDKNLYVNPSWNLGVNTAKYDNLAICNDDINFSTEVFEYISKNIDDKIIGQYTDNFYLEKYSNDFILENVSYRPSGWGCLFFLKKANWINIPDVLKVACGDDFLIDQFKDNVYSIKNLKIDGVISATSLIDNFKKISIDDIKIYEDHKNPKISILTLTYQRYHILEEAIQSYLSQDFKGESEMVIINDSPDVEYVFNHPNIRIINCNERFSSISKKLEFGYKQCKYDFIYRLDDDDLLAPWALSLSKDYIKNNIGYDVYRSQKHYFFSSNKYKYDGDNINTGNLYTKKYLDTVIFPNSSFGEDADITFNKFSKVLTLDKGYYTMIYRFSSGTYNVSTLEATDSLDMMNKLEKRINKEYGLIELHPNFKNNYYLELPKIN